MTKAIVIAAVVVAVALVVCALALLARRLWEGPGVRRRELTLAQRRLEHALAALDEVDQARENWREVDSPLAAELRHIISEHKKRERSQA